MGDVSEDIVLSGEKLKVVFSGDWELRVIFLHLGQNLHDSTKKVKGKFQSLESKHTSGKMVLFSLILTHRENMQLTDHNNKALQRFPWNLCR